MSLKLISLKPILLPNFKILVPSLLLAFAVVFLVPARARVGFFKFKSLWLFVRASKVARIAVAVLVRSQTMRNTAPRRVHIPLGIIDAIRQRSGASIRAAAILAPRVRAIALSSFLVQVFGRELAPVLLPLNADRRGRYAFPAVGRDGVHAVWLEVLQPIAIVFALGFRWGSAVSAVDARRACALFPVHPPKLAFKCAISDARAGLSAARPRGSAPLARSVLVFRVLFRVASGVALSAPIARRGSSSAPFSRSSLDAAPALALAFTAS